MSSGQRDIMEDSSKQMSLMAELGAEQRLTNDLLRTFSTRSPREVGGGNHGSFRTDQAASVVPPDASFRNSVFKVGITRFNKEACDPFCSCRCHRRYNWRSSSALGRLFGPMYFGISNGLPWAKGCDQDCTRPSGLSASFTYYFPAWFVLKRMVSLTYYANPLGDSLWGPKVRPFECVNFSMFRTAITGDVLGMKHLLDKRIMDPSASWYGGWTVLHVRPSTSRIAAQLT